MDPLSQLALGFGQSVGSGVGAAMVEEAKMPGAGPSGIGDFMSEMGGGTFAGVAINFGSGGASTATEFKAGLTKSTETAQPSKPVASISNGAFGLNIDDKTLMMAAGALLIIKLIKRKD